MSDGRIVRGGATLSLTLWGSSSAALRDSCLHFVHVGGRY